MEQGRSIRAHRVALSDSHPRGHRRRESRTCFILE
jgi:hypothetical protein